MAEKALRAYRVEVEDGAAQQVVDGQRNAALLSVVGKAHCDDLGDTRGVQTVDDRRLQADPRDAPRAYFGDCSIEQITTQEVEEFARHQRTRGNLRKKAEGLHPSTISNHVALLSAIFKTAMRRGIASSNPFTPAKKPLRARSRRIPGR